MPSPNTPGSHADHGVTGDEAALQRAPERQHPLSGHEHNIIVRAHEFRDIAAGGVVETHEIGLNLTGTVILRQRGDHVGMK